MIRHAAAVVVALCLSTSPLYAQNTLTVSEASANVHKSPSTGSPVIGKAPRGTALVVTREVGDWVKVSWPSAADGAGYVRVSALSNGNAPAPASAKAAVKATPAPTGSKTAVKATPAPAGSKAAATPTPAPIGSKAAVTSTPAPAPAPIAARTEQVPVTRPSAPSPASTLYVSPTHLVGIGAMIGGTSMGFGGSARAWSRGHLGMQLEVSRHAYTSPVEFGRATTTDIAPSLLFALNDKVSDYLWLRPYVGLGAHVLHASLGESIPGVPVTSLVTSSNTVGARLFVGGEMAFSSLPQFALSADVGYYHLPEPFVGFEPGGIGFAISGHWYVK